MGLTTRALPGAQPITNEIKTKGHIVIPYTQGLCESIKKICGRYGIQTHFKSSNIKLEVKMANFQNHRRFMLRCLSKGLIPVSIRLKDNSENSKR